MAAFKLPAIILIALEEQKCLPWAAVWDYYCAQQDVPTGAAWYDQVNSYEKHVLSHR